MKTYLVILKFTPLEGIDNFELERKEAVNVIQLVENLQVEFENEKFDIVQITLIS